MGCVTPISAAGGPRRAAKSAPWHPERLQVMPTKLAVFGPRPAVKKHLSGHTPQHAPLLLLAPCGPIPPYKPSTRLIVESKRRKTDICTTFSWSHLVQTSFIAYIQTYSHANTHTQSCDVCLAIFIIIIIIFNNSDRPDRATTTTVTHTHTSIALRHPDCGWQCNPRPPRFNYFMNIHCDSKTGTERQNKNDKTLKSWS